VATNAPTSTTSSYGAAFAAIQVGSALIGQHYEGKVRDANQSRLNTQATLRNQLTKARNIAEGAHNTLSGFVQSINNQRLADAGAARSAAALGALNLSEEVAAANWGDRLQVAQHAMGEAAAAAAFRGTTGGAQQRLHGALALNAARTAQRAQTDENRRSFLLADAAGRAMTDATAGKDLRTLLPNRIENTAIAPQLAQGDSSLDAAVRSGADFSALIRGAGDLTRYLQRSFTAETAPTSAMPEFDSFGLGTNSRGDS